MRPLAAQRPSPAVDAEAMGGMQAPASRYVDLARITGRAVGAGHVVALAALAGLGVLVGAALLGGAADPTSIADPGPVTRWGVLVSRTLYDVAAIGTIGMLLVVVVLLPRSEAGLGPDAARLVQFVTWWSAAWSVTALTTVLFTLSQVTGLPLGAVLAPDILPLVMDLETTRSMLSSAWLAGLVAVGSRVMRSPAAGLLLLVTAVGAVVLPLLTGHAGHGELAALTATSLAMHVVAVAAWVGGLAAMVVHLRGSEAALAAALPRFSRMALVCFVVVGLSGALTGWVTLESVSAVWTSSYGQLLLGKVVALGLLGLAGHRHRRRTVAAVAQGRPRAFVHLAAAELLLMACAAALAAVLSQTAPPVQPSHESTPPSASAAVAAR